MPTRHLEREAGTEIICQAFDLDLPLAGLLGQVHDLAALIVGS